MPKRIVPSYTLGARMRNRVSRVAVPRVSSSSPVASGSSVPQWPIFFWRRMRRTRCTMSCEVKPGSFSTSNSPSFISMQVSSSAQGCSQVRGHLLAQGLALALQAVAGGVAVAAAAVVAGDLLDVHLAAAAQGDLLGAVLALADEGHRLHAGDRADGVD